MELTTTPVSVMMDLMAEIVITILIIANHLLVLTVMSSNRALKVNVLSIYKFTFKLFFLEHQLQNSLISFFLEKEKKMYVLLNDSSWWLCSRQNAMFPHGESCTFFLASNGTWTSIVNSSSVAGLDHLKFISHPLIYKFSQSVTKAC